MDNCVACTTLNRPPYNADKISVRQFVALFTQGHIPKGLVKPLSQFKDDRRDVMDLHDHFSAKGNVSKHISVVERLKESLHYQRENLMSFEVFFSNAQEILIIFEDENETMMEEEILSLC